ncbi:hypothetical protein [Kitasatospora purpeofusca]|uniref:DUF4298 domain-containing protein n=1 Tax=Kitasatospora purpeofusca TaxID=67352 RepID=A0ABZ1U0V7_9ACTN|nr:hypothetical protein [Kitasatospora purpeofusca]
MTTARLQALVDRVHQNERNWEAAFYECVPTYDPHPGEQPAEDEHMGQYDEMDDSRAYDCRELLLALTAELEGIIRETEGGR